MRHGLEADRAGIERAPGAAPGDDLVGHLLGDLGVPFLVLAPDLGVPVQVGIVKLLYFLDAGHEARELPELRPLVVDGAHRAGDFNRFLNSCHGGSSSADGPVARKFRSPALTAAGRVRRLHDLHADRKTYGGNGNCLQQNRPMNLAEQIELALPNNAQLEPVGPPKAPALMSIAAVCTSRAESPR